MNILLAKMHKTDLTKDILYDLRSKFDYQLQPNKESGEYFGYHLCMDKESSALMKKGKTPKEALMIFITPEVFNLVMNNKFNL